MSISSRVGEQSSRIQQMLIANQWDALKKLLEEWPDEYDLTEIEEIITSENIPSEIRHAAYLYLVTRTPLEKLKALAEYMDFNYRDADGSTAVFYAIRKGRADVLAWLVRDKNVMLNTKNKKGHCPVFIAVANNQYDIFKQLIMPLPDGGYGLSLDAKDNFGPVLLAVAHGHSEMLAQLVKPVDKGGDGLSIYEMANLDTGAVLVAIYYGQNNMLDQLVKQVSDGGYGLPLDARNSNGAGPVLHAVRGGDQLMLEKLLRPVPLGGYGLSPNLIDKYLKLATEEKQQPIFDWLFLHGFDEQLSSKSCSDALAWVKSMRDRFSCHDERFSKLLTGKYQQTLEFKFELLSDESGLSKDAQADITLLAEAIEAISLGEARLSLGRLYASKWSAGLSFENYTSVMNDEECSQNTRWQAGFEIATLIFAGNIVFCESGEIDLAGSYARQQEKKEILLAKGCDQTIMTTRALRCLKYLRNNQLTEAQQLRARVFAILTGNDDIKVIAWKPLAVSIAVKLYKTNIDDFLTREPGFLERTSMMMFTSASNSLFAKPVHLIENAGMPVAKKAAPLLRRSTG